MIESIQREGTKVVVRINTGLCIEKKYIAFEWETGKEMFAELLVNQLIKQLNEFKTQIAQQTIKYPLMYVTSEEVSKLKSMLVKGWNGSKHCWK